jgi:uncharacterized protein
LLTADLVRARVRGGELSLVSLGARGRTRALEVARAYVDAAQGAEGGCRADLDAALAAVPLGVRERKLAAGLRKLVIDRCTFEVASAKDPSAVRRELFGRAAEARRSPGGFDRTAVVAEVAERWGMTPDELEASLYADVRSAHVLTRFEPLAPEALVDAYEVGQAQAVLLRATRVTFEVHDSDPATYRRMFRAIKFRRLLHRIEPAPSGGYRIEVTGPYSLFESVTKYGLQLALVLPAVRACERWSLDAQVRWGKDRAPVTFRLDGRGRPDPRGAEGHLPDEVRTLLDRFATRDTPWRAATTSEILQLPGVGLCVPDLVFEHVETGARVFLEVLGYWSREAVWKRVELAEAGLAQPIVFAASSRLRVSEEVLGAESSAALLVYKGSLSPGAVEARLARLAPTEPGAQKG